MREPRLPTLVRTQSPAPQTPPPILPCEPSPENDRVHPNEINRNNRSNAFFAMEEAGPFRNRPASATQNRTGCDHLTLAPLQRNLRPADTIDGRLAQLVRVRR